MVEIDAARLLDDLRTLRSFGATGTGVVRPSLSPTDMHARAWLRDRMAAAGLDAAIDGVGNVVGWSPNPGPALIVGSHSDTQPTGGWLDGALGVIYGLEVARSLLDDPTTAHLAVDAVAWVDEEATYTSCLGSKSFARMLTDSDLAHTNRSGERVSEALERTGLSGVATRHLDSTRHVGYLEAHIEQGPHLDDSGDRIGVVTSIVGIRGRTIEFRGSQNHAGTTPMDKRSDAGVALFEFAHEARGRIREVAGPATVWTFGQATLNPGAASIIPGRAELIAQFRDPAEATLQAIDDILADLAAEMTRTGPVDVRFVDEREPIPPTIMDEALQRHLESAAERHSPGAWRSMPSAAGHDPMVLAHHLPCAMLFIPSIDGVSHDFSEDTADDDIALGCQVLTDAAARILLDAG